MTDEGAGQSAKVRALVLHGAREPAPGATDAQAVISELYARMFGRTRAFAARMVGVQGAEDVVHDAFDRLWRYVVQHGLPADPEGMLFVLIRNAAVTTHRREKSSERRVLGLMRDLLSYGRAWLNPAARLERADLNRSLARLIEALPPRERELWLMVNHQGYSYDKVAQLVGIQAGTVRTAVARANRRLRLGLEAHGHGPGGSRS